ncbi:uncharacterized protein F5Z01DRAFT_549326 [Emericellopsis atlantica]|uniref:2EXR domain-containing protein n=1 Tax=Emericellopsis atlantica TaxID=2614577 RepID=A0A9P7ZPV2_9HYPO|nr:uncharacterized protein F5Z01DRAFT_549326 [Emericellopsis atlantica]KAG9255602.1 hypothetical protein F5Z01DRAFT_549326 [Emericellopsis atlantica]
MARNGIVLDTSGESSSESGDDRSDSSRSSGAALIDDEAHESSDISSSDDEDSDLSTNGDGRVFHQFARLPPELRQRIWLFVCPDLENPKPRVLTLRPVNFSPRNRPQLFDDLWLKPQTAALRLVSSIHHESRNLVTSKFPNVFGISAGDSGDGLIRFDAERDIILVSGLGWTDAGEIGGDWANLLAQVKHLAIPIIWCGFIRDNLDRIGDMAGHRIERLYLAIDEDLMTDREKRWAVTEHAHRYDAEYEEDLGGVVETQSTRWTWPDVDTFPDFAKYHAQGAIERHLPTNVALEDLAGDGETEFFPMIQWEMGGCSYDSQDYDFAGPNFVRLWQQYQCGVPLDQDSGDSGDDLDDDFLNPPNFEDAYESEGLDDASVGEPESDSGDEILPGPVNVDDSSETEAGEPHPGRFSSPDISSEEEEEEEQEPGPPRPSKRKIFGDSSDEEDEAPPAKRVRTRPVVEISDDEDEEEDKEEPVRGPARGRAQVISSDEVEGGGATAASTSSDEDDEEEDEEPPARSLTLAQRLANFREEIPTPTARARGRHHATSGGEDEESSDDDDSEEEEDSEDDSGDENPLVDDIASETDDDDGDGEDDEEEGW